MRKITAKTPWEACMGQVPMHLSYFQGTMFQAVEKTAKQYPKMMALSFMGKRTSYTELMKQIDICAKALKAIGIQPGDSVTVSLPNCPQAVYLFYAINRIGAIANMIHPMSAEKEIEFYLRDSDSVAAITLDAFCHKFFNQKLLQAVSQ